MSVLYVPIAVEAFVTNNENIKEKEIASVAPNYADLKDKAHLGSELDKKPFESLKPLKEGIHLHFILPDALTKAVMSEKGALDYPSIPNRWLVTRLSLDKKIKTKSWVVESDYIGLDNKDSITVPYLSDKETPYRYLGRSYPTDVVPKNEGEYVEKLTAVGPGDPAFAAYYPSCHSVYGFHDVLDDIPSGGLTYFVMGYYSNEINDPIHDMTDKEYQLYLEKNQWAVKDGKEQASRMICQGMVHTIPWEGPSASYPSNTPTGEVNAAIGNTSVESISAMIADRLTDYKRIARPNLAGPVSQEETHILERFLTTMQYELLSYLDGVDGIADVEDRMHEEEFEPDGGGIIWKIRQKNVEKDGDRVDGDGPVPAGTGKELTTLNLLQSKYNKLVDGIQAEKQNLFSAWQRYVTLIDNPPAPWVEPKPSKDEIISEINKLCDNIDEINQELLTNKDAIKKESTNLKQLLEPVSDDIVLEYVNDDSYYRGKPPALLLGGPGISRQYAFGEDGRFSDDDTLLCRLSLVNGLIGMSHDLTENDILAYVDNLKELPETYKGLLCEAICLSPTLVKYIGKTIREDKLRPSGTLPSPIADSEWIQPWISLFLEWSVTWIPTRTGTDPDNSMDGWRFDDVDYKYVEQPQSSGNDYMGRTILTPHSTKLLQHTLEKNIDRYKDDPDLYRQLKAALSKVKNLAVLSQQLSGIWTELLSQRETLQLPIIEVEAYKDLAVKVKDTLGDIPPLSVVPDSEFYPIRAGFIKINKVNIVNTFGIRQLVNSTLKETIYSEELYSGYDNGMLPPRFTQGAKLDFDWVSYKNKSILSCLDLDTSPVCAYFYPDLLNRALSVFDADGAFKGRLKRVYRDDIREVRWVSAPGEPADFEQVDFISNHTKQFIEALLQYNTTKDPAFASLLDMIEHKINSTCSYSGEEDIFASWCRPLALARGRINLDLFGKTMVSQKADDFGKNVTYGYEKTKIPVYIGDITRSLDGVVGFYPDGDSQYQKMHCVYKADHIEGTEYLLYDTPIEVTPSNEDGDYFTLLMEAEASVSFRTGILPAFVDSLPTEHIESVLPTLDFSFEVDPIVSNPDLIQLPLFSKKDTEWLWYYRQGDTYVDASKVEEPHNVFGDKNPICVEGVLKRKEIKK